VSPSAQGVDYSTLSYGPVVIVVQEHEGRSDDLADPHRSRLALRSARKAILSRELPPLEDGP
jgi:hypothetical protein